MAPNQTAQPTNQDILNALNQHIKQSDKFHEDLLATIVGFANEMQEQFTGLNQKFDVLSPQVESAEIDVKHIKVQMVTKNYLDTKLASQKGEIVQLVRDEDTKVNRVIDTLSEHNVVLLHTATNLKMFGPFVKTS